MNELKFKAWDIGNKKMVNDALVLTNNTKQLVTMDAKYFGSPTAFFKGCIWLQYATFKDVNDKLFCVGDIFDIHQTVNGRSLFVLMGIVGGYDVRYAFDLERRYEYSVVELLDLDWIPDDTELEIVGTIYENPEILEKESAL